MCSIFFISRIVISWSEPEAMSWRTKAEFPSIQNHLSPASMAAETKADPGTGEPEVKPLRLNADHHLIQRRFLPALVRARALANTAKARSSFHKGTLPKRSSTFRREGEAHRRFQQGKEAVIAISWS